MACYVEVGGLRLLVDAGAALGYRYGLLPHPQEYRALRKARKALRQYAKRAEYVVITHYHYDHYTPPWTSLDTTWTWASREECEALYQDKVILAKDYKGYINPSQRRRAYLFHKIIKGIAKEVLMADGAELQLGGISVAFTPPLPHGEEGSQLGYVIGLSIRSGDETLMICTDIQGPMDKRTAQLIRSVSPDLLVIGGPPLYLEGGRVEERAIRRGLRNMRALARALPKVVVDHHLLRSQRGYEELLKARKAIREGPLSLSELLGKEPQLLEARRKELYSEDPPSEEFIRWTRLPADRRRRQPPPL